MNRPRMIVIGPVPPPVHGVTISTSLVLASPTLAAHYDVSHVDTSDHRSGGNVGRWDMTNVVVGVRGLLRLGGRLRGERGLVYIPLSQNAPAFVRDSLYIHVASLSGWKVAAHLRGSDFRAFYDAAPRPLRAWMRLTLRRLESVAVMGSSLRWVFEGIVPDRRIAVVANGTPEPAVEPAPWPGHVVFLSNLRRRKGVVVAVETALRVIERHPEARFTFAGAWEDEQLERELVARAAGCGGAIAFRPPALGRAKDELLASAAVLLFPPVEPEGHPRVVLEALAAGVPVVTTDRGAIRETVTDGENGFVLDDPDAQGLADRITLLLDDEALRSRFSLAARNAYERQFTQTRADEVMLDWLASIA